MPQRTAGHRAHLAESLGCLRGSPPRFCFTTCEIKMSVAATSWHPRQPSHGDWCDQQDIAETRSVTAKGEVAISSPLLSPLSLSLPEGSPSSPRCEDAQQPRGEVHV